MSKREKNLRCVLTLGVTFWFAESMRKVLELCHRCNCSSKDRKLDRFRWTYFVSGSSLILKSFFVNPQTAIYPRLIALYLRILGIFGAFYHFGIGIRTSIADAEESGQADHFSRVDR